MRLCFGVILILPLGAAAVEDDAVAAKRKAVNAVMDDWHKAAAEANLARYFGHMTEDAVFFGTDASERWSREEFRKYAKPFFDKGKAWNFTPSKRNVFLSKDGTMAWFDEALDTPNLGPARGTGVLLLDGGTWKIVQYHLCVPIPNDVFDKVKKLIETAPKGK